MAIIVLDKEKLRERFDKLFPNSEDLLAIMFNFYSTYDLRKIYDYIKEEKDLTDNYIDSME